MFKPMSEASLAVTGPLFEIGHGYSWVWQGGIALSPAFLSWINFKSPADGFDSIKHILLVCDVLVLPELASTFLLSLNHFFSFVLILFTFDMNTFSQQPEKLKWSFVFHLISFLDNLLPQHLTSKFILHIFLPMYFPGHRFLT